MNTYRQDAPFPLAGRPFVAQVLPLRLINVGTLPRSFCPRLERVVQQLYAGSSLK
jgi:hypothetical protein